MSDIFTLDGLHVGQARSDAIILFNQWTHIPLEAVPVIKRSVAFRVTLHYEGMHFFTSISVDASSKRMNNR